MGKKSNIWRPTKKTERIVGKLEKILKMDWTIKEACAYAWIHRDTYYDRLDKHKEFSYRMEDAKTYMYMLARNQLAKGIKNWDTRSALTFLNKRDPRYKDNKEDDDDKEEEDFRVSMDKINGALLD